MYRGHVRHIGRKSYIERIRVILRRDAFCSMQTYWNESKCEKENGDITFLSSSHLYNKRQYSKYIL